MLSLRLKRTMGRNKKLSVIVIPHHEALHSPHTTASQKRHQLLKKTGAPCFPNFCPSRSKYNMRRGAQPKSRECANNPSVS